MSKRLCGGSSTIKQQHYKSGYITTYQNKIRNAEKRYKGLFKASKLAKEKGKKRTFFFFEKYPNFEVYIKTIKLKKVIQE